MMVSDHLNPLIQAGYDGSLPVELHQSDVEDEAGENAEDVGRAVCEKVIDDLFKLIQGLVI